MDDFEGTQKVQWFAQLDDKPLKYLRILYQFVIERFEVRLRLL